MFLLLWTIMKNSNYLRRSKRRKNRTIVDDTLNFSDDVQIAGIEGLANLLEVDELRVEQWIQAGMPVEQVGDELHDWIFNFSQVKAWVNENS